MEEKVLDQNQALTILVQSARIAQSRGVFSLEDAEMVLKAIRVFSPKDETKSTLGNTQPIEDGVEDADVVESIESK